MLYKKKLVLLVNKMAKHTYLKY